MEGEKEVVLVVCAKEQDAAMVYDINTGEKILFIPDCVAPPGGLAFVDGHLLAASRSDKNQPLFGSSIYIWAPNKLQETHKSYVGEAIGPITCSKDGMYLVGGAHSGNAYIWEVPSGILLKRWCAHKNAISFLSFSPDSSLVISGSIEGTVHTWSMISLFQEEPQLYEVSERLPNSYNLKSHHHKDSITGILIVLRGPCPMLITSSLDGTCKVRDIMSGALLETLALSSSVTTIAVDPLEQLLVCGAADSAIYGTELNGIGMQKSDPLTLYEYNLQVLSGHKAPISALAFSSNGILLVSASKECNVLIWDSTTWQVVRILKANVGFVTNLLVIRKTVISKVQSGRNSPPLKFATLEKICKPTNEAKTFLLPSGFSKDANCTHVRFQSADILSQQILELEEKRSPEAIEMIVGMKIEDQVKNQTLAKELTDMNMLLQLQLFDVMEVRACRD